MQAMIVQFPFLGTCSNFTFPLPILTYYPVSPIHWHSVLCVAAILVLKDMKVDPFLLQLQKDY